jgi:uncharacterized RDD family membrane protein YckC
MAESAMGADQGTRILAAAFPETGEEKTITVVGIGPRLVARLLDTVLIFFLSLIVAAMIGIVGGLLTMFSSNISAWTSLVTVAAGLVFSLAYYVYAWGKDGQTLGDTLLGIRIVNTRGEGLSTGQAIVRYIGYLISAAALSLGFLWIAFDGHRQGWHDKLARTYVIPAVQRFSSTDRVTFAPADKGATPIWIGAWVVLAIVAPGALVGGLLSLGPFVDMVVKNFRAG